MAVRVFQGGATPVAQTATFTVSSSTNTHTFILSAVHPSGSSSVSVTIQTTTADGVLSTTQLAAAVAAAWNASTHPYATAVTASSSSNVVMLTADRPGVPFVVSKSGTGTSTLTTTQANCGPNSLLAENIADGTLPGAADDLIVTGAYDLLYNLDFSGTAIESFTRWRHTGCIGWPGMPLKLDPDRFIHDNLGGNVAYIDVGSANCPLDIINAGSAFPISLYLTGGNSSAVWQVHNGNVGVAWNADDVATAASLLNYGGSLYIGQSAVVTNYRQSLGSCWDRQTANRTLVLMDDGNYVEELAGTLSTFTKNGGRSKHLGAGAISAGTIYGGWADFISTQTTRAVTLSYIPNTATFGARITGGTLTPLGKIQVGDTSGGGGGGFGA